MTATIDKKRVSSSIESILKSHSLNDLTEKKIRRMVEEELELEELELDEPTIKKFIKTKTADLMSKIGENSLQEVAKKQEKPVEVQKGKKNSAKSTPTKRSRKKSSPVSEDTPVEESDNSDIKLTSAKKQTTEISIEGKKNKKNRLEASSEDKNSDNDSDFKVLPKSKKQKNTPKIKKISQKKIKKVSSSEEEDKEVEASDSGEGSVVDSDIEKPISKKNSNTESADKKAKNKKNSPSDEETHDTPKMSKKKNSAKKPTGSLKSRTSKTKDISESDEAIENSESDSENISKKRKSSKTPKSEASGSKKDVLIDDKLPNDSDLSSLEDDAPPRKKNKPKAKIPTKKAKTSSKASLAKDPEEERINQLKIYVVKCGVRKVWKQILADLSPKEQIRKLKDILKELGMEGQPSLEKCKIIAMRRELENEVEGLDTTNILTEERPTRRQRAKINYAVYDASDSEESEVDVTKADDQPSEVVKPDEEVAASDNDEEEDPESEDEYVESSEEEIVVKKRKSAALEDNLDTSQGEVENKKKSKTIISESEPESEPEANFATTPLKKKSPSQDHTETIKENAKSEPLTISNPENSSPVKAIPKDHLSENGVSHPTVTESKPISKSESLLKDISVKIDFLEPAISDKAADTEVLSKPE